jgi:membrane fusion protein
MLFREEAVQHAAVKSLGEVILTQPVSHKVLTAVFSCIGIALVLFFCLFSYSKKANVSGILLPTGGLARVVDAQPGVVVERLVAEGQNVRAGDVLFVIKSDRASLTQGDAAQTVSSLLGERLESLRHEKEQLQKQSEDRLEASAQKVAHLEASLPIFDEQILLQKQKVSIAEDNYNRFHNLEASHFVSGLDVQQKRTDLLEQRLRLSDLQRSRADARQELALAQSTLEDQKIQRERDQEEVQRNIAVVQQDLTENEAKREIRVPAPQRGIVSAVTVDRGQSVASGQTLAVILPENSQLEADLYAPSSAAGFLKPGMPVQLRYAAYPYQKFGLAHGVVQEVASIAIRPEEIDPLAGNFQPGLGSTPVYRVRVKLERQFVMAYGSKVPLRAGSTVDASIPLERRRLIEWVIEPLYSISGHI